MKSDADPGTLRRVKHIFVTGGVVSSLGKGLTAASLGCLLSGRGLRVAMQKLDPYLNVDPGTMNPFQHGEVFITEDGSETDLDIGHYERFLDVDLTAAANVTTGQIYSTVIARERRGEYLGNTVQVIPHITDEIKRRMRLQSLETNPPDVIITEIGGTVGDIESLPFIEAARQLRHDLKRENCFFLHVSLVPYLASSREQKTKPTQHSVNTLRSIGIQPDALVLRSDRPIQPANREKIGLMCDVPSEAVIEAVDVESLYDLPDLFHRQGLDDYLIKSLGLETKKLDNSRWAEVIEAVHHPRKEVTIALVGKYTDLPDAYISVIEALRAGGFAHKTRVYIRWVAAHDCIDPESSSREFNDVDGVCVPGGFGVRDIEGLIGALAEARRRLLPTLGLCLGMQCMIVEYARAKLGLTNASSTEFDPDCADPVICTMAEQLGVLSGEVDFGASMRLGAFELAIKTHTLAARLYGKSPVSERHRHRYHVNKNYLDALSRVGMVFSATTVDGKQVEMMELDPKLHPFYIGTQAHPELKSRPNRPHPLFAGLIEASLIYQKHRQAQLLEE